MKNNYKKLIVEAQKEILIKILLNYEKNRLGGKGFDFYFAINHELDNLKKQ